MREMNNCKTEKVRYERCSLDDNINKAKVRNLKGKCRVKLGNEKAEQVANGKYLGKTYVF